MDRPNDYRERRYDPRPDERERRERPIGLPIEREHETQAGIFEEDERRERERARQEPGSTPERM